MKQILLSIATCLFITILQTIACAQGKMSTVFLLEDAKSNEWCAFKTEALWQTAVQNSGSLTVGKLVYSDNHLFEIDMTQAAESGDWIIYDRYFLNTSKQVVKLRRTINILPGDRSVSERFSLANGKARKIQVSSKQLSTGKLLKSPKPIWLPELPINTTTKMFPFASLLDHIDIAMDNKVCAKSKR